MCDGCQKTVETQTHVIFCPAYTKLREGRDIQSDKDLVNYFREVQTEPHWSLIEAALQASLSTHIL